MADLALGVLAVFAGTFGLPALLLAAAPLTHDTPEGDIHA